MKCRQGKKEQIGGHPHLFCAAVRRGVWCDGWSNQHAARVPRTSLYSMKCVRIPYRCVARICRLEWERVTVEHAATESSAAFATTLL